MVLLILEKSTMLKFSPLLFLILINGCANYVSNMHKEFDNYDQKNSRTIQSGPALNGIEKNDKRYVADDFQDKSKNNSLWVGNGKENFFSSGGVRKEKGDLVTIDVYKKLKDQITSELSRFYPGDKKNNENDKKQNNEQEPQDEIGSEKIQDKISVVVTKEVRENHLILTGRKQLIYKDNRHLVEVQALVHRKDITTDDTLDSGKIIQSTVKVLR